MNLEEMKANIISCRNLFLNGKIKDSLLPALKNVVANFDIIPVIFTRNIVEYSVKEAVKCVEDSEHLSAARILNLIHNLPFDKEEEKCWDIDYFLEMELPSFLEHYKEIKNSRNIVLFVCNQIAFSKKLEK